MTVFLVVLLAFAVIITGAVTGVFISYTTFVKHALGPMQPAVAARIIRSMIHASLRTPVMAGQFSAMLLGFVTTGLVLLGQSAAAAPWVIGATVVQFVGSLLVSAIATTRVNDRLTAVPDEDAALEAAWSSFRREWLMWNRVRTYASLLACAGFAVALRLA